MTEAIQTGTFEDWWARLLELAAARGAETLSYVEQSGKEPWHEYFDDGYSAMGRALGGSVL